VADCASVPDGFTLVMILAALYGPVNAYLAAPYMESWGELSTRMRFITATAALLAVCVLVGLVVYGRLLEAALLSASASVSVLVARYRRKQLAS
jgi:hypothetical protein